MGAPSISPLEPPHRQLRHAVRDLANSTTGVIGYVQIYPGGTERPALGVTGILVQFYLMGVWVEGRPFVRVWREESVKDH